MRRTVLALGATAVVGALLTTSQPVLAAPPEAPQLPARYAEQDIRWKPCFDPATMPEGLPSGSERLRCGSFLAPRDWNDPRSGESVTIAVTRLSPVDGSRGRALFTNPGGPGGAGRAVPLAFLGAERTELLDTYDIYGVDVRGTGDSTNVTCGNNAAGGNLDPRDRSRRNLRMILDSARLLGDYCQYASGELDEFVTTEQTVHDFDLLRRLEGRQRIDYWGVSGGTWLGAYYTEYFPEHTGHFVLDSNVNFTTSWQNALSLQPAGVERAWRERFLPWAAEHSEVYGLGSTPAEIIDTYDTIRARLAENPIPDPTYGQIGPSLLDLSVRTAMYSTANFDSLARSLGRIEAATAPVTTTADREAALNEARGLLDGILDGRTTPNGPNAAVDASTATSLSIVCNDTAWRGDGQDAIRRSAGQGAKYPIWGWHTITQPCLTWDRTEIDMPTPDGEGIFPVLMLQNTHDPATPVKGARHAHQRFDASRMITVLGESDHGAYGAGNACVDEATDAYLVDGVVPEEDFSCQARPLPKPGEQPPPTLVGLMGRYGQLVGPLPL